MIVVTATQGLAGPIQQMGAAGKERPDV